MIAQKENEQIGLHSVPTVLLVEELVTREGVSETVVAPYEEKQISANGPARVLLVID